MIAAELVVACDGCGRLMAPEVAHLPHLADCRGGLCRCPDRWFCPACCDECRPGLPVRWAPLVVLSMLGLAPRRTGRPAARSDLR